MKIHIICLLSLLQGDLNNASGVARSIASLYPSEMVVMHEVKADKIEEAKELIGPLVDGNKIIVIGAGDDGLKTSLALKATFKDQIYTAWSGHQLPEGIDLSSIDRINLPRGTASHVLRVSDKLTETTGVPHNLTKADLEAERIKWSDRLPATDKKKLIIILSGDAPLPDNITQKFYLIKEAEELANYVADWARKDGYYIYVTNGPRTGKYNNETSKEDKTVHRSDADLSIPTDPVSAAFITHLESKGLARGKDFYFADFRYGSPSVSAYKAFLGSLGADDHLILPGESVSMFSETLGLTNNRIGYITGSMNDGHHKNFAGFQKESPIAVLSLPTATGKSELTKSALMGEADLPELASATIAKVIQTDLSSKGLHK